MAGPHGATTQLEDVLGLVIGSCQDLDISTVCSLLCASGGCRRQLQRARGHCSLELAGGYDAGYGFSDGSQLLAALGEWLPNHPQLISVLRFHPCSPNEKEERLLQRQLALALRPATAAAAEQAAPAALLPPVRVESFCASVLSEPALLGALAGVGLRELEYQLGDPAEEDFTARFFAALGRLTSLQHLDFTVQHMCPQVAPAGAGLASAVQKLTQLTQLQCNCPLDPAAVLHLPCSLRVLHGTFTGERSGGGSSQPDSSSSSSSSLVDLRHLTALQRLVWWAAKDEPPLDAAVGPQLTALVKYGPMQRLTGGSGLKAVNMPACYDPAGMSVLPSLSSLAGPWRLTAKVVGRESLEALQQAAAAIGSARGLTSLELDAYPGVDVSGQQGSVEWGRQLARLPGLQVLRINSLPMQDLLQLSALTALRELSLENVGCIHDVGPALLALTQLQRFRLVTYHDSSAAVLPAAAALTGLHTLSIIGGRAFVVRDAELMLLSRLTQLSSLFLRTLACSNAGKQAFLSGMPRLRRVGG